MPAAVWTFLGKFLKFCPYIRAKFSEISIRPCHLYSGVLAYTNSLGGTFLFVCLIDLTQIWYSHAWWPLPRFLCMVSCVQLQDNMSVSYILFVVTWAHNASFWSVTYNMVHCYISPEVKKVVLWMALVNVMKYSEIWKLTTVSKWATSRLCNLYCQTSHVICKQYADGHSQILNRFEASVTMIIVLYFFYSLMVQFLEGCIEWQPYILLMELQNQLKQICGIKVSPSTI